MISGLDKDVHRKRYEDGRENDERNSTDVGKVKWSHSTHHALLCYRPVL